MDASFLPQLWSPFYVSPRTGTASSPELWHVFDDDQFFKHQRDCRQQNLCSCKMPFDPMLFHNHGHHICHLTTHRLQTTPAIVSRPRVCTRLQSLIIDHGQDRPTPSPIVMFAIHSSSELALAHLDCAWIPKSSSNRVRDGRP